MITLKRLAQVGLLCTPLVIAACGGDSNKSTPTPPAVPQDPTLPTPNLKVRYNVNIYNLTNNQPIAPVAVILHGNSFTGWQLGSPASAGLEVLAESGSPADFISGAGDNAFASGSPAAVLGPGGSTTVTIDAELTAAQYQNGLLAMTLAGMPVNTNDAFSGVTGWDVGGLDIGDSVKAYMPIYDAGTEANTETAATVPGPAAGGEGFNAARDDTADQVTRHPGVVTSSDGYAESALDQSHRFDQNALLVTITRAAPE